MATNSKWEKAGDRAFVAKVEEGEEIIIAGGPYHPDVKVKVLPSCGGTNGRWYCATHKVGFRNQFEKDLHIGKRGRHKLAWLCFDHGAEVP